MKFYRKYLLIFVLALLAGICLHSLLFFVNLGVPMEQERYVDEWLAKKDAYASSISGRKIIFISGSNTLFGVDTQQIENTLGIPTINYGVHASLFYYTLKRAKEHLAAGDIVILPLEYPYYTWHHDVFDPELSAYLLGYAPSELANLYLSDKLKFIAQQNTKDLATFAYQQIIPAAKNESAYSSQYLNTNGDMTNNHMENKLSDSALQAKSSKAVFKETPLTADAKAELTDFINYCHTNNITIYATWPNFLWNAKEFNGKDLDGIYNIEKFYHEHNVEILGHYTDCLYDVNLFYNTNYHLNDEGKRIHTDYLINLLKEKLPQ